MSWNVLKCLEKSLVFKILSSSLEKSLKKFSTGFPNSVPVFFPNCSEKSFYKHFLPWYYKIFSNHGGKSFNFKNFTPWYFKIFSNHFVPLNSNIKTYFFLLYNHCIIISVRPIYLFGCGVGVEGGVVVVVVVVVGGLYSYRPWPTVSPGIHTLPLAPSEKNCPSPLKNSIRKTLGGWMCE